MIKSNIYRVCMAFLILVFVFLAFISMRVGTRISNAIVTKDVNYLEENIEFSVEEQSFICSNITSEESDTAGTNSVERFVSTFKSVSEPEADSTVRVDGFFEIGKEFTRCVAIYNIPDSDDKYFPHRVEYGLGTTLEVFNENSKDNIKCIANEAAVLRNRGLKALIFILSLIVMVGSIILACRFAIKFSDTFDP